MDRWFFGWAIGAVGFGGASLLVPLYIIELNAGVFLVGLSAALSALVGAPAAMICGRYVDRTRRFRDVLLGCLLASTVLLVLMPFSGSVLAVVGLNAFLWFAYAAAVPVLTLFSVEGIEERKWQDRIGKLSKFQGYGWAAGLIIGGLWSSILGDQFATILVYRSFFLVCGALTTVSFILVYRYIPSSPEITESESKLRTLKRKISQTPNFSMRGATNYFTPNGVYWGLRKFDAGKLKQKFSPVLFSYFVLALLFFTAFSIFFAPLPIYLKQRAYSSDLIFLLYVCSSTGSAMFYGPAGRLVSYFRSTTLQGLGIISRGILFPLLIPAIAFGLTATATLFLLIGVSWALISVSGSLIVTKLSPAAIRGESIGIYAALGSLGGFAGSIIGGALAEISFQLAFVAAAALSSLSGVILILLVKIQESRKNPSYIVEKPVSTE